MQSSVQQAQKFGDIRIDGQSNQLNVNQIFQITADTVHARTLNTVSPYLGLERFEEKDARLFFGRGRLINELLTHVKDSPFTLVAGASGSGKSSIIRAGLIPQLHAQFGPRTRVLLPIAYTAPLKSLASELLRIYRSPRQQEQFQTVEPTAGTLLHWASTLRPPADLWLLVFDQFEELFTGTTPEPERSLFLDALVRLIAAQLPDVRVVLAMRADFMDHLGRYPELARLVERNLLLVSDMTQDELRAAIEQPAAQHGVLFEKGLVEQVVADVKGGAGALPLLQYTMDQLWTAETITPTSRELAAATYHRIGGVAGALERRAQALYEFADAEQQSRRSAEEQACVRSLLLRLVTFSGTSDKMRAVSKPEPLSSFPSALERRLIAEFVEAKLLVTDRRSQGADAPQNVLEIAHEALLSAWKQLAAWIEQAREAITLRNQLALDSMQWQRTLAVMPGRAEEDLWSGTRLQAALELERRGDFASVLGALADHEAAFLRASENLQQRREDEREERRLRRIQALQRELDGYIERGRLLLLDGRPLEAAPWLASAYERGAQHPMLPYLLHQAMLHVERVHAVLLGHDGAVRTVEYSRDGRLLVTASRDGTARIWSAPDGAVISVLRGHRGALLCATFDSAGERVLTAGEDGTARIWDASSGALIHTLDAASAPLCAAELSPDGRLVLTASQDGALRIWDSVSGQLGHDLGGDGAAVRGASFSPDGRLVLSASENGVLRLWTLPGGELLAELQRSGSPIVAAQFSPDGTQLVAFSQDRRMGVWDTRTCTKRPFIDQLPADRAHEDVIRAFAFAPDGERVATASDDGTINRWNVNGASHSWLKLVGHDGPVTSVAYSPDGNLLCSSSEDGTVRLWPAGESQVLQGPLRGVAQVRFSPDGRHVAACAADGTTWIWSVTTPELCSDLGRADESIYNFSLSPDGRLLATMGDRSDKRELVRIRERESGRCLSTFHSSDVCAVQFSRDSSRLLIRFKEEPLLVWDVAAQRELLRLDTPSPIRDAELSPDGCHVLTQHEDESLRVWEVASGHMLYVLDQLGASSITARFEPAGKYILTISLSGMIRLLHPLTGERLAVFRQYIDQRKIESALSADGSRLLLYAKEQLHRGETPSKLVLWSTGDILRRISSASLPPCKEVQLDPTGRFVACVERYTNQVCVYDAETWSLRGLQKEQKGSLCDLQFSPDGARLATFAMDGVRVFECESAKLLLHVALSPGEQWIAGRLRFTEDGRRLVVLCERAVMYVIDVEPERRTASELTELLRSRVPYQVNGQILQRTGLTAWHGSTRQAPAPALRFSQRRSLLWRAIHQLARGEVHGALARLAEAETILTWFGDAEGVAMQQIAAMAARRRLGEPVDADATFRSVVALLEREIPLTEKRAAILRTLGDLALCKLQEPHLAIAAYEEHICLSGKESIDEELGVYWITAHLCQGQYTSALSIADKYFLSTPIPSSIITVLGWLASVMIQKTLTIEPWSIRLADHEATGSLNHGRFTRSEFDSIIKPIRTCILQSAILSADKDQILNAMDALFFRSSGIDGFEKGTEGDCVRSVLLGRQPLLKRIATGDFRELMANAEAWWEHLSKLCNWGDLLWSAIFWSLSLQVDDPELRFSWASRIEKMTDSPHARLPASDWFLSALEGCRVPIRDLPLIRRVFQLLDTCSESDRPELIQLLI